MGAFPSAAAQVKPFDPFEYRSKALQIQQQQQSVQSNDLDLQAKKRAAEDDKTIQQAVTQNPGKTLHDLLPTLSGHVTAARWVQLNELDSKMQESFQKKTEADLKIAEEQHKQYSGIYGAVMNMPDEQVAANWPQIAQSILAVPGNKLQVDPAKPMTKQEIQSQSPMLALNESYLQGEIAKRKAKADATVAEGNAAEAPAKLAAANADAEQKKRVLAGTSPTGITAEQQAQNSLTRRGQDLAHKEKSGDDQAIEIAAQALANGELTKLKDIVSMRGDQRLRVFARAKQLNPNFTTAELDRKIKMEDQFTNGKDGQNLQSFGTFLEHAGAASEITNAFRTTSIKLVNTPLNKLRDLAGDASYNDFIGALEPVRKEFEGFLLGGRALYGDDRKNAEKILSDDSSPAQIQEALKRMGHTVKARFNEANFRYQRVMGHDLQDAVSPEAQAGAQKIGVDLGLKSPASSAQPGQRRVIDLTK